MLLYRGCTGNFLIPVSTCFIGSYDLVDVPFIKVNIILVLVNGRVAFKYAGLATCQDIIGQYGIYTVTILCMDRITVSLHFSGITQSGPGIISGFLGAQHFKAFARVLPAVRTIVGNLQLATVTAFGSDHDHTCRSTGAVYRRGTGVFQHGGGLNIEAVDIFNTKGRHTVYDVERLVTCKRSKASDTHEAGGTRLTGA